MGRAKGSATATATVGLAGRSGRRSTGAVTHTLTIHQMMEADGAFSREGEILQLQNGEYEVAAGDSAAGIAGLDNVKEVQSLPNGLHRVTFNDGTIAMVNTSENEVALSSGDDFSQDQAAGALYAAMAHKAFYDTDPATADPDDPRIALGDAFDPIQNSDEPATPEQLAAVALAAQQQLEAAGGEITINPESLNRLLAPEEPMSDRAKARQAMQSWRNQVTGLMAAADDPDEAQRQAALGLLLPVENGEVVGAPTLSEIEEAKRHAQELGAAIPELKIDYDDKGHSVGDFEVGAAEKERIDIIRNALGYGDRAFAFRGPPGSGKDAMAEQIAAILQMPYVPINLGPSTDMEMNIGGDGLKHVKCIVESPIRGATGRYMGLQDGKQVELEPVVEDGVIKRDKNNFPILTDGKNEVPAITESKEEVVATSQMLIGPIAQAVSRSSVTVLQEPRNMNPDSQRLNATIGDGIGAPGKRYLNINSSAAGEERRISIPVHPDCIMIMTYNPGQEDNRMHASTHDRMVNLDFDYPSKEAECRRYAKIVNRMMKDDNNIPDGLRREWEPETFEPIVGVLEKMRNASRENASFIEEPGSRTGARFFMQLVMQSYQGDNRGDRTARLLLDYCRSYDEKTAGAPDSYVNQILSDELPALQTLNDTIYNEGAKSRGEEPLSGSGKK